MSYNVSYLAQQVVNQFKTLCGTLSPAFKLVAINLIISKLEVIRDEVEAETESEEEDDD